MTTLQEALELPVQEALDHLVLLSSLAPVAKIEHLKAEQAVAVVVDFYNKVEAVKSAAEATVKAADKKAATTRRTSTRAKAKR